MSFLNCAAGSFPKKFDVKAAGSTTVPEQAGGETVQSHRDNHHCLDKKCLYSLNQPLGTV